MNRSIVCSMHFYIFIELWYLDFCSLIVVFFWSGLEKAVRDVMVKNWNIKRD